MNSAWSKLLIVIACTLAESELRIEGDFTVGDKTDAVNGSVASLGSVLNVMLSNATKASSPSGNNATVLENLSNVCSIPCSLLGARLRLQHLITPCMLALFAWLASSLPTFVLRSRYRVCGIRCCLWPVLNLWLALVVSYNLYLRERVYGFVWMLHSSAHMLAAWSPPRQVLAYQWAQPLVCFAGALAIGVFAWASGGSASLIRWRTGAQSQCGWSAHLVAVLGVDLAAWLLRPLEALVLGPQPGHGLSHGRESMAGVIHLD